MIVVQEVEQHHYVQLSTMSAGKRRGFYGRRITITVDHVNNSGSLDVAMAVTSPVYLHIQELVTISHDELVGQGTFIMG
jgi:hypothetical protein